MDTQKCETCSKFTTVLAADGARYPACHATRTKKVTWYVTEQECKYEKKEEKKLTKCPYCGSAGGVCSEFKVSGIDYYRFNGLPDGEEITGPYEHTKYVECIDCGKRIMTYEEFKEDYINEPD